MNQARGFFAFLSERGRILPIAIAVTVGCALLLFGGTKPESVPTSDSLESRAETICERICGSEGVSVMITTREGTSSVLGVAAVCPGADSPELKLELTEMFCALFGIGAESVCIIAPGGAYNLP